MAKVSLHGVCSASGVCRYTMQARIPGRHCRMCRYEFYFVHSRILAPCYCL